MLFLKDLRHEGRKSSFVERDLVGGRWRAENDGKQKKEGDKSARHFRSQKKHHVQESVFGYIQP